MLGAKRWDVLVKVGLPRSMPYFYGSLKVAITLAFVGTVLAEMTAGDSGIGYLMQLGRQPAAHAAGVRRPGDDRRDGDGDVRAVLVDREAHHRLGAPRLAGGVGQNGTVLVAGSGRAVRWRYGRPHSARLVVLVRPAADADTGYEGNI